MDRVIALAERVGKSIEIHVQPNYNGPGRHRWYMVIDRLEQKDGCMIGCLMGNGMDLESAAADFMQEVARAKSLVTDAMTDRRRDLIVVPAEVAL